MSATPLTDEYVNALHDVDGRLIDHARRLERELLSCRRELSEAVAFIRTVGEEVMRNGYPCGDRETILANVRREIHRANDNERLHHSASENAHMHYRNSVMWKTRAEAAEAALAASQISLSAAASQEPVETSVQPEEAPRK